MPDTPMFMRGPHDPIRIERAEGPWLYASDGNKILDAGGGAVVVNIGQGRREIAEVAARTIAKLDYIVPVWTSPEREKLVDRLTRWTPAGLTRFFFTSGGSEAVEAAMKFAILYHKARGQAIEEQDHRAPILLSRQYHRSVVCRRQSDAAPTTSMFCSIGRRSIRPIAIDARGAKPIRRAISTAPPRSKKKS